MVRNFHKPSSRMASRLEPSALTYPGPLLHYIIIFFQSYTQAKNFCTATTATVTGQSQYLKVLSWRKELPRQSVWPREWRLCVVDLVDARTMTSPSEYWPEYSHRKAIHCKHPAHSCVVGCKERGGLTYSDSLNSSGNCNNAFVCCAGHSWYNTSRH